MIDNILISPGYQIQVFFSFVVGKNIPVLMSLKNKTRCRYSVNPYKIAKKVFFLWNKSHF